MTENVVPDDKDGRNANKGQHLHPVPNAGGVVTERTVTSDRKRKCSSSDDDMSVGCRCWSSGDDCRCELSKSIHPAGFAVEHPITVRMSSAVIASTPSDGAAVLRTVWSPPTHRHDTSHGEPLMPEGRPPPTQSGYTNNNDKLFPLPLGVVDIWHKNWSIPGTPNLISEPTLYRESILPVLLLTSTSCC